MVRIWLDEQPVYPYSLTRYGQWLVEKYRMSLRDISLMHFSLPTVERVDRAEHAALIQEEIRHDVHQQLVDAGWYGNADD